MQEGAVLAAQVFENRAVLGDDDAGMAARNGGSSDPHRGVVVSPQHVLSLRQRDLSFPPDQSRPTRGPPRPGSTHFESLTAEAVAEAIDGPDEARAPRVIAQSVAKLAHDAHESGLADPRARPEPIPDVRLRKGPRPAAYQELEQLERLRAQADLPPRPQQLPALGLQQELAETDPHVSSRELPVRPRSFRG